MTPEVELDAVLAEHRRAHVVCFGSPSRPATPPDLPNVLALNFHDIAEPREGHVAPSRSDIDRLILFARAWNGNGPLVMQCWMGVSRSTAGALIAGAALGADPNPLARRLRMASPAATPNPLMLRLADKALNLRGALAEAGGSIGRGTVPVAHPFVLALRP